MQTIHRPPKSTIMLINPKLKVKYEPGCTSLVTEGVKNQACNAGDPGSIPRLGRCLGEGNGSLLQYSCLENPMKRGACWAAVHGVAKRQTTEQQSMKPDGPGRSSNQSDTFLD